MRTAQGFPFASLPVVTLALLLCALLTTATAQPTLEVRNDDGEVLAPGAADELGILAEPRLLHYTVTNTGNKPLELAAELANDQDAAATLQNEPASPLAPGESTVLCLWLGVNTWRFSVELHLTSNDPDPQSTPHPIRRAAPPERGAWVRGCVGAWYFRLRRSTR